MALNAVQTLGTNVTATDLSALIEEKCSDLHIDLRSVGKECLNSDEKTKVDNVYFSEELDFQEDPKRYVLNSKKAFKLFISGLNDGMKFDQVIKLTPHDPKDFPYQMGSGKIDFWSLKA